MCAAECVDCSSHISQLQKLNHLSEIKAINKKQTEKQQKTLHKHIYIHPNQIHLIIKKKSNAPNVEIVNLNVHKSRYNRWTHEKQKHSHTQRKQKKKTKIKWATTKATENIYINIREQFTVAIAFENPKCRGAPHGWSSLCEFHLKSSIEWKRLHKLRHPQSINYNKLWKSLSLTCVCVCFSMVDSVKAIHSPIIYSWMRAMRIVSNNTNNYNSHETYTHTCAKHVLGAAKMLTIHRFAAWKSTI